MGAPLLAAYALIPSRRALTTQYFEDALCSLPSPNRDEIVGQGRNRVHAAKIKVCTAAVCRESSSIATSRRCSILNAEEILESSTGGPVENFARLSVEQALTQVPCTPPMYAEAPLYGDSWSNGDRQTPMKRAHEMRMTKAIRDFVRSVGTETCLRFSPGQGKESSSPGAEQAKTFRTLLRTTIVLCARVDQRTPEPY